MTDSNAEFHRELSAVLDKIFTAGAPEQTHVHDAPFDHETWSRLQEAGFAELTGSEAQGGAGAGWDEAALVLRSAGAHAVRVPYAQHDVLGGWLLDQAGLDRTGSACRTVAVFHGTGSSAVVPWARDASHVVALINSADAHEPPQWQVANLPISSFAVENAHNLAGEPRDVLTLSTFPSEGVAVAPRTVAELELRSSLAALLLSGGAAQRIVELAVEHANTRSQFGRVLSRFQAVQQLVADLAAEAALVQTVAAVAARTASDLGFEHPRTGLAIAAASSSAAHSVSLIVRNAHQVLGAIGYTSEHALHHYTNRLLSWRSDQGSTRKWDDLLLQEATAQAKQNGLWPWLVDEAHETGANVTAEESSYVG